MKKKSILAMLLTLALLASLLAGCGSSAASASAASAPAEAASSAAAEEETAAPAEPAAEEAAAPAEEESAVEEASAEEPEVMGPEAYYACEETTEVTVLFQFAAWFQGFFPEGWGQSEFWTEFGEATNTTWSLQEIANMAWTENVNLLCAAGDLPDVVLNLAQVYNGGLAAAIRDEQVIDIAPLIKEYAPNYYELVTSDENTLRNCIDDDGQMGAMYPLSREYSDLTDGLWIRQDWLDELGLEVPNDPDSMYDVMCAFRDNFGATQGFYQMIKTNNTTMGIEAEGIWNAYGPVNYYLDDAGTIQCAFNQDYYFEYLAYLQKLANDGLFITSTMTDEEANYFFTNDLIGIEGESVTNAPDYIALMSDEDQAKINLVAMPALGEPSEFGEEQSLTGGANAGGGTINISTNCEHPEVVLKAMDYLYTDQGGILSVYGEEGISFEYDENGNPQLTDLIINNPDGIPLNAALGYWCNPGIAGLSDASRTEFSYNDNQKAAADIWASAYTGSSATVGVDGLSLTEEEQDTISVWKSDLKTYVDEWVNDVVFNNKELSDANIQAFQDYIEETFHLSEMLEVYNTAYQRYLNRELAE